MKKEKRINDQEEKASLLGTTFKLAVQTGVIASSFQVSLAARTSNEQCYIVPAV